MTAVTLPLISTLILWFAPLTPPPLPAQTDAESTPKRDDQSGTAPPPITGRTTAKTIELSISEVIRIALARNLAIQIELLNAYQTHGDIGLASAAFDPLFTTDYSMSKFRTPTVDTLSGLGSTTQILVNPFTSQRGAIGINGLMPLGTRYSLSLSDSRSDNPQSGFFGFNPRNNTTITANIQQPLLKDFGYAVQLADLRIAHENDAIAKERLRAETETVVNNTINAYWSLYFTYKDLEVKQSGLLEAEDLLSRNQDRLRAGTGTQVDITQAQANIAEQKSGIIQAENAVMNAQDTLLDLLNYREHLRETGEAQVHDTYDHLEIVLTTPLVFEEYPVDVEDAILLAHELRSDIRQAEHALTSTMHSFNRADHNLLPSLNLDATWNQLGLEENIGNSLDELFSGRYYSWTVAVNFEYALGNRSARTAKFKAQAAMDSARLDHSRLRNLATLEVTRAIRDIRSSYRTVIARQEQVRLQRETLEGEAARLTAGASTAFQVFEVQNNLLEAESQELQARVDHQNAITAYLRAVGTLLTNYAPVDIDQSGRP